jgi:adenylate kinase family enzyme
MQFLGIEIGQSVPDEKIVRLFKERLSEHNLFEVLFDLFTSQLCQHGIAAKEGSIVDTAFDVPAVQSRLPATSVSLCYNKHIPYA